MTVSTRGLEKTKQTIKNLINAVSDCSGVFKKFIKFYQLTIKDAFTTQGATFGKKWPNYSPGYKKWKQKHGNKPKLILSGKLFAATQGGQGFFQNITPKSATFGITGFIPYAGFLQRGRNTKQGFKQWPYFLNYDNKSIPIRALNFLHDELLNEFQKAGNNE